MSKNTESVLKKAREIFTTCQIGLRDLMGDEPARRIPGFHNVVVFGRSVTFTLQNLRGVESGFDDWYLPRQKEMTDDPLLKYFSVLRNTILKEGGAEMGTSMYIEHLDTSDLQPLMQNPPPGAMSFFIGDQVGGSGWEVELTDGSTEKFYVALPEAVRMQVQLNFPDPPTEHAGVPIEDTSVENLSRLYVTYLSSLMTNAESEFGNSAN